MTKTEWKVIAITAIIGIVFMAIFDFAHAGSSKPKEYDRATCLQFASEVGGRIAYYRFQEKIPRSEWDDEKMPEEWPEWAKRLALEWLDMAYSMDSAKAFGQAVGKTCEQVDA